LHLELSLNFHPLPNGILTVGGVSWQGNVSFAPNRTHACNVPLPNEG
jgi:hypothetical protein